MRPAGAIIPAILCTVKAWGNANKIFSHGFFVFRNTFCNVLILKVKNSAPRFINLLKPAPLLASAAVKWGFSTKFSTDFVDRLKSVYETAL